MSYAEDHRKHMQNEIDEQNKEWHTLNRINRRGKIRRIEDRTGIFLCILSVIIMAVALYHFIH